METASLPETVQAIVQQAGGLGLQGAFVYVGAQHFTYRCAEAGGEYWSNRTSRLVSDDGLGFVDYEVGLQCRVNGKRGHDSPRGSSVARLPIGAEQQQTADRRTT